MNLLNFLENYIKPTQLIIILTKNGKQVLENIDNLTCKYVVELLKYLEKKQEYRLARAKVKNIRITTKNYNKEEPNNYIKIVITIDKVI